jgi:myo-inositol-1(or 4)-monophosphatase
MKTSEFLKTAIDVALESGKILEQMFGTNYEVGSKEGCHNLVTACDKASEDYIIDTITKRFPSHQILAEESGASSNKSEITWIIDPLDGTVNFAHNIPVFSVSIGVAIGSEIVCGVVYQPLTKELFYAQSKQGAFLNQKQIYVTTTTHLKQSFLATGFPYNIDQNPLSCLESFSKFSRLGIPIRRLGSAAIDLAYVAAGRYDGYWEVILQPWDYAAGLLLVQEAGGKVTNYQGTSFDLMLPTSLIASNNIIHPFMMEILCK